MRPPAPLPAHLSTAPFTVYEARAASLGGARLRSSDLTSAGRLIHVPTGWDFEIRSLARALSAATPGAWISHLTAAVLLGLWLPSWYRGCRELHLRKRRALPPVRRAGVVGHTVLAFDDELMVLDGIRISTPARTWLDLARILPLDDLVAVGDQLVRQPRAELEDRTEPWATLPQLAAMLTRHPKLKGIVKAREATALIRPGADSAPETFLRLALTAAGAGVAAPDCAGRPLLPRRGPRLPPAAGGHPVRRRPPPDPRTAVPGQPPGRILQRGRLAVFQVQRRRFGR
ncbi:hypothetical protein M2428_000002 [Arthrobacter sp. ES3-54]|nr:hypothetical protein [Arthrobacter sp. ES3-54]